jgi:hypothetical protein
VPVLVKLAPDLTKPRWRVLTRFCAAGMMASSSPTRRSDATGKVSAWPRPADPAAGHSTASNTALVQQAASMQAPFHRHAGRIMKPTDAPREASMPARLWFNYIQGSSTPGRGWFLRGRTGVAGRRHVFIGFVTVVDAVLDLPGVIERCARPPG